MINWNEFIKIESKSHRDNLPIQIGRSIVVDGYIPGKKNAVFTHFHHDHISHIDDTLRYDKILLHPITYFFSCISKFFLIILVDFKNNEGIFPKFK